MTNLLSERIAFLRKGRGLTQEQLGQLVGVSAQAVSKWEKGGAPDVELLPALADQLGVTIDGLFGRDDIQVKDFSQQMGRWLSAIPAEDRMEQLIRALANSTIKLFPSFTDTSIDKIYSNGALYSKSCYTNGTSFLSPEGESFWLRCMVGNEAGVLLGVFAEDFPLYLLLPEPPQGYESNFASNEDYRRLFSALSQKGSLEILRYLYEQKKAYYTAAAVAKRTRLPLQTVERAMEAMAQSHLFYQNTIEAEDGSVTAYSIHDNLAFVPFLYLARWLMEKDDSWLLGWQDRERPLLVPPDAERKS